MFRGNIQKKARACEPTGWEGGEGGRGGGGGGESAALDRKVLEADGYSGFDAAAAGDDEAALEHALDNTETAAGRA
jgi:hypothetical protein